MKKKILLAFICIFILLTLTYNLYPEIFRLPLLNLNRKLAGLSTKTIIIGDHKIHYLEGGSGTPIILLHGIFSEKDHWVDFARHLTPEYQVIIPDLAGFGESTRIKNSTYSYDEQTKIFEDFVKALRLKTFHLAGNSMGGTIAVLYSLGHKDTVKSIALIGGPHGIKTQQLSEMDKLINEGQFPLVPKNEAEFERMLNLLFKNRPFIPGPIFKYSEEKSLADSNENSRIFQQQLSDRYLLHSKLAEISAPTLILWGQHEKIFHPEGAQIIQETSPTKTTVELIDAGHLPQMEKPKETATSYKKFLMTL